MTASFLLITALFTIKVVYSHTGIALYRHWGTRSAGERVKLLALAGRRGVPTSTPLSKLAGGLPSGPILSRMSRTEPLSQDQHQTIKRCLIISKVTLTGQSHFLQIFFTLLSAFVCLCCTTISMNPPNESYCTLYSVHR
jgi:hypothetical protein